jgi:hypothetical protein
LDYTEDQLSTFKADFARRKRNQFLVAIPLAAIILPLIFFEERAQEALAGIPVWVSGGAVFVAIAGALVFSWQNWRYPACNKYFGRSTSMAHCPSCGVALK